MSRRAVRVWAGRSVSGLVALFTDRQIFVESDVEWRAPRDSNARPSASEADTLSS